MGNIVDLLIGLVLSTLAILMGFATFVAIFALLLLPYIIIGWLIWFLLSPISETLALALIIGIAILWAFEK